MSTRRHDNAAPPRVAAAVRDLTTLVTDMGHHLVHRNLIGAQKLNDVVLSLTATQPGRFPNAKAVRRGVLIVRMYFEANLYTRGSDEITSLAGFFGMEDLIDLNKTIAHDDFYYYVWDRQPYTPAY